MYVCISLVNKGPLKTMYNIRPINLIHVVTIINDDAIDYLAL